MSRRLPDVRNWKRTVGGPHVLTEDVAPIMFGPHFHIGAGKYIFDTGAGNQVRAAVAGQGVRPRLPRRQYVSFPSPSQEGRGEVLHHQHFGALRLDSTDRLGVRNDNRNLLYMWEILHSKVSQ